MLLRGGRFGLGFCRRDVLEVMDMGRFADLSLLLLLLVQQWRRMITKALEAVTEPYIYSLSSNSFLL